MRICIICPVRKGTPSKVFGHVEQLEKNEDNIVFFPPRDIPQTMPEPDICQRMLMELELADEVHVWYSPDSQGVHFDLGILWGIQPPPICRPNVVWLNPSESRGLKGYEAVLKGMARCI